MTSETYATANQIRDDINSWRMAATVVKTTFNTDAGKPIYEYLISCIDRRIAELEDAFRRL